MNKVYLHSEKIFKSIALFAIAFGVTSCASSSYTAASSGETDGVYYSPSNDGKVNVASNETSKDYEIKVGGAYFDADGNGAEEYYYENESTTETKNINIYTGNSLYVNSNQSSDWGRYDGLEINVTNWGWNDPWMFGYGYNSIAFGWGWNHRNWRPYYGGWNNFYNPYWGYGGFYSHFNWGWNNFYQPWGWGYNPYYGGYYGNHFGGYYGGYYGNGYYAWNNRRNQINPGYRQGSNLAFNNGNGRNYRNTGILNSGNVRNVRTGNEISNIRTGNNVRTDNNIRTNTSETPRPVRVDNNIRNSNSNEASQTGNIRQNNSQVTQPNVRPTRPVVPQEVKTQQPVRTQQGSNNEIRNNNSTNSNNSIRTSNNTRPTQSVQTPQPTRSNASVNSSGGTRSSNTGVTNRGGGSRR